MSGVRPSDEVVERIMDMTDNNDIRQKSGKKAFTRVASAVLALAVVVGSGFGVSAKVNKANDGMSIIVACADEVMSVKSATKQHLCYTLNSAPSYDTAENERLLNMAKEQYDKISSEGIALGQEGESASWSGVGVDEVFDPETGESLAKIYSTQGGYLAVNKKNYDNVALMTVKNESKYGVLHFESPKMYEIAMQVSELSEDELKSFTYGDYRFDENDPCGFFLGHSFTLTGDELREYQSNFNGEYGYTLNWEYSQALSNALIENPEFDVTSITDKITFTFTYADGTTESTAVSISFDSNGFMQIEAV